MRFFGKVTDPKDLTTKEYVDDKDKELEDKKVDKEDISEYTAEEVLALWNSFIKESS